MFDNNTQSCELKIKYDLAKEVKNDIYNLTIYQEFLENYDQIRLASALEFFEENKTSDI
jgi:hypothetical protein